MEFSSRVSKRTRTKENTNGGVDIISHLPEHILHHIFTFLDMEQAIQTCLLSRRWRYFWASLPTLKFNFDHKHEKYQEKKKYSLDEVMAFVDRVLMFRGNSDINEFVLFSNDCIHITYLNTWILALVKRNVQQLILETSSYKKSHCLCLHHCLFTCKSLTKLVVIASTNGLRIRLPDSVTLPRLKTLSLDSVTFEGGEFVMDRLFSNCPVLESLILKNCEFPHHNINISSLQLQHLVLLNCRTQKDLLDSDPVDIKFNLCAPNLLSFYCDNAMSKYCAPNNLSSLVKAVIYVYPSHGLSKEKKAMYAQCMVNILRELHNVEDLTLSALFPEVITGAPDLLSRQPTKLCNLRSLKLMGTWHLIDCIPAISYLLKISPNIETLFIQDWYDFNIAATDLLDVQPTQFCNLRCLKMNALLSRDGIYPMACLLKICPIIEILSYTVYHEDYSSDDEMNPYCDKINSNPAIKRDYWEAGLSLECLLNNLKCFELRDVEGRINELEFLEILLKNAMQLEKLLIVFKTTYSEVDEERRRINFTEKVLTFPRASLGVVILFK